MEAETQYPSGPASLFHAAATKPRRIWFYCGHYPCYQCQYQTFSHREGEVEVYKCDNCGGENKKAVR